MLKSLAPFVNFSSVRSVSTQDPVYRLEAQVFSLTLIQQIYVKQVPEYRCHQHLDNLGKQFSVIIEGLK